MLTRGRVLLVAVVVLGLMCALLVLIWAGGGVDPDEDREREIASTGPTAPSDSPGTAGASRRGPRGAGPGTGPSGAATTRPPGTSFAPGPHAAAPASVNGASAGTALADGTEVLARLVDRNGVALPFVPLAVRTVNPPQAVLTARSARTDRFGQFRFRAPDVAGVLQLWCPRFTVSVRRTWGPDLAEMPLEFRLDRAAVVGRLVGPDGQPPRWPGFHLRLALRASGGGPTAPVPVTYATHTGGFVALVDGARDLDLEVVALGDTGHRRLALVPAVNRMSLPLTVTITSPEAHFGGVTAVLRDVPELEGEPGLEAWSNGKRRRLPMRRDTSDRYRVGPLAPHEYRVRVVAGDHVSAWRRAAVRSGRTLDLGALVLRPAGRLRVRPVGRDGATLRGVRLAVIDASMLEVPVRFQEDARGQLATRVSAGRYEVRAYLPHVGSAVAGQAPAASTVAVVQPGGVHEVVLRLP